MNIRKSAMITVLLGCVFATQALAKNCSLVEVHISKPILNNYVLSTKNIVMNHGDLIRCSVNKDDPINGDDSMTCTLHQGAFYGPDASLTFVRKTDGQLATIRVQQNYCFMEAGNITVEPIRGNWVYRTREGNLGFSRPGTVWLDQVSLNN